MKPSLSFIGTAFRLQVHIEEKRKWPWYGRFIHWLFVSWRCELCKIERQNRKVIPK